LENTVNIHETNGRSVTEALPELRKSRNRIGAESTEGRLLSTLIEQLTNYQKETDPTARANLERMIGWTTDKIEKLRRSA
jgi:hypothetical protein